MIYRVLRLLSISAICVLPVVMADAYGGVDSSIVDEMLIQINELRAKSNKGKLQLDDQLMQAAQLHTEDQARNGIMTHDGKRLDSKLKLGERVKKQGFQFTSCAENVAAGQKSVSQVMRSWIKSPGHLKNLLGKHECVGIGHAKSTKGRYTNYWTQVFGTRRNGKCIYTGQSSSPADSPAESPTLTPMVTTTTPAPTTTSTPETTPPTTTTTSAPETTPPPTTTTAPETTTPPEMTLSPPVYPATPSVSTADPPCTINIDYDAIWSLIQKHLAELTKEPGQTEPTSPTPLPDNGPSTPDQTDPTSEPETSPGNVNPYQTDPSAYAQ